MGGELGLVYELLGVGHAEANDSSPLAFFHERKNRLGQVENRMQIVIEHRVPTLVGFLEQRDPMVRTGAVDQRVDPAPLAMDSLNQGSRRVRFGYVALERQPLGSLLLHEVDYPRRFFGARAITNRYRPT